SSPFTGSLGRSERTGVTFGSMAREPGRPLALVVGTVGVVLALVVVIFLARWATTPAPPRQPPASKVVAGITSIPASDLAQVGRGTAAQGVKEIQGPALVGSHGNPEVLFIGAEYCPYR